MTKASPSRIARHNRIAKEAHEGLADQIQELHYKHVNEMLARFPSHLRSVVQVKDSKKRLMTIVRVPGVSTHTFYMKRTVNHKWRSIVWSPEVLVEEEDTGQRQTMPLKGSINVFEERGVTFQ